MKQRALELQPIEHTCRHPLPLSAPYLLKAQQLPQTVPPTVFRLLSPWAPSHSHHNCTQKNGLRYHVFMQPDHCVFLSIALLFLFTHTGSLVWGFCPPEQNISKRLYWQTLILVAVAKAGSRIGPDEQGKGSTFNTAKQTGDGFQMNPFAMPVVYD